MKRKGSCDHVMVFTISYKNLFLCFRKYGSKSKLTGLEDVWSQREGLYDHTVPLSFWEVTSDIVSLKEFEYITMYSKGF